MYIFQKSPFVRISPARKGAITNEMFIAVRNVPRIVPVDSSSEKLSRKRSKLKYIIFPAIR